MLYFPNHFSRIFLLYSNILEDTESWSEWLPALATTQAPLAHRCWMYGRFFTSELEIEFRGAGCNCIFFFHIANLNKRFLAILAVYILSLYIIKKIHIPLLSNKGNKTLATEFRRYVISHYSTKQIYEELPYDWYIITWVIMIISSHLWTHSRV